jgi:hypothetical protein
MPSQEIPSQEMPAEVLWVEVVLVIVDSIRDTSPTEADLMNLTAPPDDRSILDEVHTLACSSPDVNTE